MLLTKHQGDAVVPRAGSTCLGMKPVEGEHACLSGLPTVASFLGRAELAHLSTPGGVRQNDTPGGGTTQSETPGKAIGPRRVYPPKSPSRLGSLRSGPQGSRRGPRPQPFR